MILRKCIIKLASKRLKNEDIYELAGNKDIASAIQNELVSRGEIFKLDASYYIDTKAWDIATAGLYVNLELKSQKDSLSLIIEISLKFQGNTPLSYYPHLTSTV